MGFDDVFGQDGAKQALSQMVGLERVPHAILLHGAEGSGNLALAIAFAQHLLCEKHRQGNACEKCFNCIKAAKWIHPDIHFSFPTVGSNATSDQFLEQWRAMLQISLYPSVFEWLQLIGAENKQGNINKEECLNIVRKLSLKAYEANYKILIMWLPEYLGKEGNRLLKLIEEPPAQTIFLLVAEHLDSILDTVLSRCQTVKLSSLNDSDVVKGLVQYGFEKQRSLEVARLANGNLTEAISLAKNIENDNAALFLEWMRKCYKGNSIELVQWVERFSNIGREAQKFFIRYALHFMREYLFLSMTNEVEKMRLSKQEKETAVNFRKIIGFHQLEQIVKLLDDLGYHIERNANPKVLFLDASLRMNKLLKT
jgi:DNA polymerase-3 subunit delta'